MIRIISHRFRFLTVALPAMIGLTLSLGGCKSNTTEQLSHKQESTPVAHIEPRQHFDSDSAYHYVKTQVAMGPRVAGTDGARQCSDYIVSELKRHGAANVSVQEGNVEAWNGDNLALRNVMGSFNPEAKDRVLLVAHYDTRPWADSDETEENRSQPIPGANDGASGVGVLLEIARLLGQQAAPVGVDLLFVDGEDYGKSSGFSQHENSWCLGTQYWVDHMPYRPNELPRYGILLDMVGGTDAKFHREFLSDREAPELVSEVWAMAEKSGYGDRFINKPGGAVVDDHLFLCRAGIPTVDIIESKNDETKSFPPTWHTMSDDMRNIDRSSLKAVGQTVTNMLYELPAKK